jgi:hypothetical protein
VSDPKPFWDHEPKPWWRQWQPCELGDVTSSSYLASQDIARRWREINEEHARWEALQWRRAGIVRREP